MHHLVFIQVHRARLTWLASMLVLLLQRTPVLRILLQVDPGSGMRAGQLLRAAIPAATVVGVANTVTGATQFTSNPTSPASGSVGQAFDLVFAVTGAPSTTRCYSIDGPLPAGLSVPNATVNGTNRTLNASNGSITGTPTEGGNYSVTIRGWEKANRGGKSSPAYTVALNIAGSANVAPSFTQHPGSQTVTEGGSVTFTVAAGGTPEPTLQWRKGGATINGATGTSLTLTGLTTADAGTYDCVATNSAGSATSNSATLTVNAATVAPSFSQHPASQTVTVGGSATFTVAAGGTPTPTLQWRKDGAAINGQTAQTLTLSNITASNAGTYDCVATNSAGSATSSTATLTVEPPVAPTPPEITMQPEPMVSLAGSAASFCVQSAGTGLSFQWKKDGAPLAGANASMLYLSDLTPADAGIYSVAITNGDGLQSESESAALTVKSTGAVRLMNVSTRAGVGSVTGSLIPGFVVNGDVAIPILIRAVGPKLGTFGVTGALEDPVLTIYSGTKAIVTNDNWEESPNLAELNTATVATGAFALDPGSADAAVLVVLNPGPYTVVVTGKNGSTGESLVEVYEATP